VSRERAAPGTGALVLGAGLAAVAMSAWFQTVRDASSMSMPGTGLSLSGGTRFTIEWGVMMAAMMLPSAAPMVMLYRTVSRRLAAQNDRVIPPALFAGVYLLLWLALGIPVYAAHVAVARASTRSPAFDAMIPYAVATTLALAGAYQLTAAKQACLRHCESPLGFLMRRWRSGYGATLRLAAQHAGYCIGCCWGLMAILVAVGAMSLPWVVAITVVVFAEKMLPRGWWTARLVGGALLALALAVALRPELAGTMRGQGSGGRMSKMEHARGMPMP
jgi:predicted metal-binding membrane protein